MDCSCGYAMKYDRVWICSRCGASRSVLPSWSDEIEKLRAENAGMEMLLNEAEIGAKEHEAIISALKAELEEKDKEIASLRGKPAENWIPQNRDTVIAALEAAIKMVKGE